MTDQQLALIDPPPEKLSARQQQALDHLRHAGPDGLTAHELGTLLYGHRPEARSWGNTAAQALRRKGRAVQRGRARVWVALTEPEARGGHASGSDRGRSACVGPTSSKQDPGASGSVSDRLPDGLPVFNSMPEGF